MKRKRIFRPECRTRGDANVTPRTPIDEASWIWRAGCEQWGAAAFADTRPTPESLARAPQLFLRFRCDFDAVPGAPAPELDVSADERFILLLDGEEIGRGPHRGLPNHWHAHAYLIEDLVPGRHRLEAVCWQIGPHAPLAQRSVRGGFVLKASGPYDEALTTGKAPWKVAPLTGTRMTDKGNSGTFGVGSQCEVRGTCLLDELPPDAAWEDAVVVRGPVKTWAGLIVPGWILFPTPLPDMMLERKAPGAIRGGPDVLRAAGNGCVEFPHMMLERKAPGAIRGGPDVLRAAGNGCVEFPPHTRATFFWDLENYYCAYPEIVVSGGAGARIRWDWAECLVGPDGHKRDRAAWQGLDMAKCFGDTFLPDGRPGARFTTPWWRCGRWCRIEIETADAPLSVDSLALVETRLPASLLARFECEDGAEAAVSRTVSALQPPCERVLQMCMHEMFFDCPYYEQQMYPGDSRVQYLVATLFGDTGRRAVRNAIALYDADRRENGLMPMNCPTRGTQESMPFTCCQAMMLGDLAWNHDDPDTLRARLPGLVHTLLGLDGFDRGDGLLVRTSGWNFIDWVQGWGNGVPPDGDSDRPNCEINLEFLHALLSGQRTAEALGEDALAAHFRSRADRLRAALRAAFWCPDQALFASNLAHDVFSQHSQALALLADVLPDPAEARRCFDAFVARSPAAAKADVDGPKAGGPGALPAPGLGGSPAGEAPLAAGSIYFRHYLFAAYFKFRRPDLFFAGLDLWRECVGSWHCSTIPEIPDPDSRSDCHGWGSHPLWHLHTGVSGVRSDAPFYRRVLVDPQPGPLRAIRSATPTPHGDVALDLHFDGGGVSGTVTLPPALSGTFRWAGADCPLSPGCNRISRTSGGGQLRS